MNNIRIIVILFWPFTYDKSWIPNNVDFVRITKNDFIVMGKMGFRSFIKRITRDNYFRWSVCILKFNLQYERDSLIVILKYWNTNEFLFKYILDRFQIMCYILMNNMKYTKNFKENEFIFIYLLIIARTKVFMDSAFTISKIFACTES